MKVKSESRVYKITKSNLSSKQGRVFPQQFNQEVTQRHLFAYRLQLLGVNNVLKLLPKVSEYISLNKFREQKDLDNIAIIEQ